MGPQGPPGTNGTNGTDGTDGTNGEAGAPGTNGNNGTDGVNGEAGLNALIIQIAFTALVGTDLQLTACPSGGTEIDTGTDDGTGHFVAGTENISYVCNGSNVGVDGGDDAPSE